MSLKTHYQLTFDFIWFQFPYLCWEKMLADTYCTLRILCQYWMLNGKTTPDEYGLPSQLRDRVEPGLARQIQWDSCLARCESVSVQSAKASVVQDFSSGRATWAAACRCAQTGPEEAPRCTIHLCSLCCLSFAPLLCLSLSKHTNTNAPSYMHIGEFSLHSWKDWGHWLDAPDWEL